MYFSRTPHPRVTANEPSSPSGRPGPKHEPFSEPTIPVWPTGLPHGKHRLGLVVPDLRICDKFEARKPEVAQAAGRNEILAGGPGLGALPIIEECALRCTRPYGEENGHFE